MSCYWCWSATFDTINHLLLFPPLQSDYGITGNASAWLESYFNQRTQVVAINGHLSGPKQVNTGLLQGLFLGQFSFNQSSVLLFRLACKHVIHVHMHTGHTQFYLQFNVNVYVEAACQMEVCLKEMRMWMRNNHLKLNDSKTEAMIVGSDTQLNEVPIDQSIGMERVNAITAVQNIGAVLDNKLDVISQIINVCKSCYVHIRSLSKVRPFLSADTAFKLVHAFISSKLDYHNAPLYGISDQLLNQLQRIQNTAARIVTGARRSEHITLILCKLHWLPVKFRI